MTRKCALKRMRRLFPPIALREAFARKVEGRQVEVGIELRSGEGGRRGRRELIRSWRAPSWDLAIARAGRVA